MDYFGKPKMNPDTLETERPVPAGELCLNCEEVIKPDESGILMPVVDKEQAFIRPMHDECFLRGVFGSVGCQLKLCTCHGGPGQLFDPKYMTKRQAAIAAFETYDILHQTAQLEKVQPSVSRSIEVGFRAGSLPSPGNLSVLDVACAMRGFPTVHPFAKPLNARDLVILEMLCEVWENGRAS